MLNIWLYSYAWIIFLLKYLFNLTLMRWVVSQYFVKEKRDQTFIFSKWRCDKGNLFLLYRGNETQNDTSLKLSSALTSHSLSDTMETNTHWIYVSTHTHLKPCDYWQESHDASLQSGCNWTLCFMPKLCAMVGHTHSPWWCQMAPLSGR